MIGASKRSDDAARAAENLPRPVETDDLIGKPDFFLTAKKAVPAGQKAPPAVQNAMPDIDPLATERLDAMIRGRQPPHPSDSGINPGPGPVVRPRYWRSLTVRLILGALVTAVLALFLTGKLPSAWNIGARTDVGGTPAAGAPTIEGPHTSTAGAPIAGTLSGSNAAAPTAAAPSAVTPSVAAPAAAVYDGP